MSIESGLFTKATDDAGVAALIGSRFFPLTLPQKVTLPAVAYQSIGGDSGYTIGTQAAQINKPVFQLSIWAETYIEAVTVAAALTAALDHQTGTWDDTEVIGAIFVGEDIDIYEPDMQRFQRVLEIMLTY